MLYSQYYKMKEPEGFDYYDIEDYNFNIEILDGLIHKLEDNNGSTAIEHTITIPASSWETDSDVYGSGGVTTVNLDDTTPTSIVMICMPVNLSAGEFNTIYTARINPLSVNMSSITLRAYGYVPTIDIHLSFIIMNRK